MPDLYLIVTVITNAQTIIDMAPNAQIKKIREEIVAKARQRITDYLYPQISEEVTGRRRLIDQPPALFHVTKELEPEHEAIVHEALESYRLSMPDERRVLLGGSEGSAFGEPLRPELFGLRQPSRPSTRRIA